MNLPGTRGNEMTGKVVVVTGATSGIGKETARALARQGAHVVVAGRNESKCAAVAHEIRESVGRDEVDHVVGDLSIMTDVRRLADEIRSRFPRVDVLVNNAGAIHMARETTSEGYERTIAGNHLGPFLLSNLLLPAVPASGRVVVVSSEVHRALPLDFEDLHAERRYFSFGVYGRSKLMNVLFTRELARRAASAGVTVNALHPGIVASSFMGGKQGTWGGLGRVANRFLVSNETGAATSVFLASDPSVAGVTGKYFERCKEKAPSRAAHDDAVARRLWEVSASLTGLGR